MSALLLSHYYYFLLPRAHGDIPRGRATHDPMNSNLTAHTHTDPVQWRFSQRGPAGPDGSDRARQGMIHAAAGEIKQREKEGFCRHTEALIGEAGLAPGGQSHRQDTSEQR